MAIAQGDVASFTYRLSSAINEGLSLVASFDHLTQEEENEDLKEI